MTDQNAPAPAGSEQSPIGGARPAGETPAPAEQAGAAATPQADEQTTDANEDGDEGQKPEPQKTPRSAVRKINRLERALEAAERRAHELAMAAVSRGGDAQRPAQNQSMAEPKPEQFTSWEDFQRAKDAHTRRTILAEAKVTVQNELRTEANRQSFEAKKAAFIEAVEKAKDRYPDFEEVVYDPEWTDLTLEMRDVIAESDKQADLSYYLATHREDTRRISKLSPLAQARELGRIEATLQPPAARKTTSAPDPVKTVAGKDRGSADPDNMGMAEWMKWRNKQLASQ